MPETQPISFSGSDTQRTELLLKPERHCVGMVLPDTWVVSGTICAKMADGWERSADAAIVQAARAAKADHVIRTLPDSDDAPIHEEAGSLSLAHRLEAGLVQINQNLVVQANLSYGGVTSSGLGKETSLEAMLEHFPHKKTIMVNMG